MRKFLGATAGGGLGLWIYSGLLSHSNPWLVGLGVVLVFAGAWAAMYFAEEFLP